MVRASKVRLTTPLESEVCRACISAWTHRCAEMPRLAAQIVYRLDVDTVEGHGMGSEKRTR